jgi:hypothetical protein
MEYHLLDQIVKSTFAFSPSSICKVANPTSPSCQLHIANLPSEMLFKLCRIRIYKLLIFQMADG